MRLILMLLAGIVSGAPVQDRDVIAREAYLAGDSATAAVLIRHSLLRFQHSEIIVEIGIAGRIRARHSLALA